MNTGMKAAQISKAGGDWELVERDIPEPGAGQVRVKVEACGICHSDLFVKEGLWLPSSGRSSTAGSGMSISVELIDGRDRRVKGRASIAFQFERFVVDGESQPLRTP
jgi:NADPH:quinone reductase-like Zn-dependent oxidoreductase